MLDRKMLRYLLVALALAVATLTAPRAASAEPSEPASPKAEERAKREEQLKEARQHFLTALDHYAKGHYRQAIIELRRAHALDPSGKDLLYNLAVVHEKLGEIGPALSYYRRVYELEPEGPDKERIGATITRLEGAREELIRARLDGQTMQRAHELPVADSSSSDPLLLATASIAAVAIVVSAVFGARALALRPGPSNPTGGDRDVSDVRADARAAHRSAVVADVSLLAGLVSGSVASVLYLGRERTPAHESRRLGSASRERPAFLGLNLGIRF